MNKKNELLIEEITLLQKKLNETVERLGEIQKTYEISLTFDANFYNLCHKKAIDLVHNIEISLSLCNKNRIEKIRDHSVLR